MTTSKLEEVARAMVRDTLSDCSTVEAENTLIDMIKPYARAAIEVMREPNEAMINAGYSHPGMTEPDDPRWVWHLMIDAALAEGGEG